MLNYIWAGLIIFSLLFALWHDAKELRQDRYRNGKPLPVRVKLSKGADPSKGQFPVTIEIAPEQYKAHFDTSDAPAASYPATVERIDVGHHVRFEEGQAFPQPLATMRDHTSPDDKQLLAKLSEVNFIEGTGDATITFPPVRFVKLGAITTAAVDMAKRAVTIALELIGTLALWLGLVNIADKSGLINLVVLATRPLLRPLFPHIPRDHPAFGMISLSLAANVLGLGNAATPLGIKAMEELQKLNPSDDTATDPMVMFLAINTASVQIVPPAALVAIMGLETGRVFIPMLIVTALGTLIAIVAVKLLGMLPGYRASDPMRRATAVAPEQTA